MLKYTDYECRGKIDKRNAEIIEDIKEILSNESLLSDDIVNSLIKGKISTQLKFSDFIE